MPQFSLASLVAPAPTAATLPPAVEVGCSDRCAEAVARGEVPAVEVFAPSWRINHLLMGLPEHDESEPVDPSRRLRVLIGHHLVC